MCDFRSKESYWQKIITYSQIRSKNLIYDDKQLTFCVSIFFLYCLHEYNACLAPDQCPGQTPTQYLLVEAFVGVYRCYYRKLKF